MPVITNTLRFITWLSIEGKRVIINESNKANCEVIISNVGPEDMGRWKFRMIYEEEGLLVLYEHEAKVEVKGK